jgi:hypothetical protein
MAPLTIPLDDRPFPGSWCRCCGQRLLDVATVLLCVACFQASRTHTDQTLLRCTRHGRSFDPVEVAR